MQDNLPQAPPIEAPEIEVFDKENPRSVINLVPSSLGQAIEDAAFEHPEYFDKDEHELYKYLRSQEATPNPIDNRLRLKFWVEYDRAQSQGNPMRIGNIIAGVCTRDVFATRYQKIPEKIAWMLCPPTGYLIKCEEALEFGIEQLRDILGLEHTSHGRLDAKLAELKLKIVAMLDNRVKGAVVQKSMNLNVNSSDKQIARVAAAATMEDLQKQLKELELRAKRAANLPITPGPSADKTVIDVEPE